MCMFYVCDFVKFDDVDHLFSNAQQELLITYIYNSTIEIKYY
jgi:hypothetical protein